MAVDMIEMWEWSNDSPPVGILLRVARPILTPDAIPTEYVAETGESYALVSVDARQQPDGTTIYLVRMKRV
jgi:hypothetical protein